MKCLVIGGGGAVGVSLLYLFKALGWRATVVDPVRPKHWPVHEEALRGTIEGWTEQPYSLDHLHARLQKETFDAVIDLAPTFDKRKSVTLCDEAGVSLINSTMVDWREDIHIAAYNFLDNRPQAARKPHIVAAGMNPGALNAMAEEIIRKTEQPDAIVYWEYDDTMPACGKYRGPSITWCPSESAAEIIEDWNFEVLEEGCVLLHEDAMDCPLQKLERAGVPLDLVSVPQGAEGFLIGHEECIYMGWRHDTAVKFVYGFHPENMRLIRAAGYDLEPELLLRQQHEELIGRDVVGAACRIEDNWRGQYCVLENSSALPLDTNATCALVAAGVAAAARVLCEGDPKPGVHLTHELKDYMRAFRTFAQVHEYELIDGASRRILPEAAPPCPPLLGVRPAIETN